MMRVPKWTFNLSNLYKLKQCDDMLSLLADFPHTQQHAVWMLSSTGSSTNFIHSLIGVGSEGCFPSDEFRCVVRAKLGLGPTNDPPGLLHVCACQKSFDAAEDSLHALSCDHGTSAMIIYGISSISYSRDSILESSSPTLVWNL